MKTQIKQMEVIDTNLPEGRYLCAIIEMVTGIDTDEIPATPEERTMAQKALLASISEKVKEMYGDTPYPETPATPQSLKDE